jgi:Methyltransferase domain
VDDVEPLVRSFRDKDCRTGGLQLIFGERDCQMTWGERAVLEGLLCALEPALSIEIGTAQGGSLRPIAAHSHAVHCFDLVAPTSDLLELDHVQFHTGDNHQRLPKLLRELAQEGRNVDFVLVDGDHSAEGVRQDVRDLLRSPATADTVILLHDSMNEQVRSGIEQAGVLGFPKVAAFDLDAVPGRLFGEGELQGQMWGGFGLIKTDARRPAYGQPPPGLTHMISAFPVLSALREDLLAGNQDLDQDRVRQWCWSRARLQAELRVLRDERDHLAQRLDVAEGVRMVVTTSKSWKLTRPLREVAAALRVGR